MPLRAEHIMAMPSFRKPSATNRPPKSWTTREVRQLIADTPLATPRYELVDGQLLVTPSPSWTHQRAVKILLRLLDSYLLREPVGAAGASPFDVELEPGSLVQPDVFVLPLHEDRRLRTEMPARELLLAAEVLSPSSGGYDRVEKRPVYQRHVPEYWIVDLDARLVERWRPADERPEILVQRLEWHPTGATAALRVDVAGYFADVFGE